MADKKIATDGSSSEERVKDHRFYLYQIQKIMAELSEKYKDELLASKAAKEKKRISEKNIVDISIMMAGNVKLEKGAESTGSDSKGTITEKVKAVEGDFNVKEMTTLIESDSDAKGSVTGERVGAAMGAFKKTHEKEAEKDSLAGVAKACKEGDKEEEC